MKIRRDRVLRGNGNTKNRVITEVKSVEGGRACNGMEIDRK